MKILNRKEFLKLPSGVFYSTYEPTIFGTLCIKGETIENSGDFYMNSIVDSVDCFDTDEFVDILHNSKNTGKSFNMNFDVFERDGLFEKDQLFCVWEKKDVGKLIDKIK